MLRIRFDLTPIDRVSPWGRDRTFHWFGLTDGRYCLEADGIELLRYAAHTIERSDTEGRREGRPWVDYYVVRLWEDLLVALPSILEPVPADIAGMLPGGLGGWTDLGDSEIADSPTVDAAYSAFYDRCVDTHYLRFGPDFLFVRTVEPADSITLSWRFHRDPDGEIVFTAPATGTATFSTDEFLAEITGFHDRLIAAMQARVDHLTASGAPPSVELDLPGLVREHADRSTWLARALQRSVGTDWEAVRAVLPLLLGSADRREDHAAEQG